MKKFVLVFALFLLAPRLVSAAGLKLSSPPELPLSVTTTLNNLSLSVDETTISSWQGSGRHMASPLLRQALDAKSLILEAVNQTVAAPSVLVTNYDYNLSEVYAYARSLESQVNQPAQEPLLDIENGRAAKFVPPQDGIQLDALRTTFNILSALQQNRTNAALAVATVEPSQQLSGTNDLGINELLSSGVSRFNGSPNNRRHNIKVGVEKMTGLILAPGEEFSFNKFLGPVVAEQGFLPELVIKSNETIPELGGGLCQVSTTTFRAAMQAGLPITQRRNHAYAVQYYSPQGTDATIYPGSVDLKFINDTPGHLLIWPHFLSNNSLAFDFYGTSDGRQVVLKDPVQFDRKPDGSMKATWERQVTKNGQTTTDVFKSSYLPPALFHKQEQFVTPTTSPTTFLKPAAAIN